MFIKGLDVDILEKMWSRFRGGKFVSVTNALFLNREDRLILLEKEELGPEDELILDFSEVLNAHNVRYAVVAGYLSILFGRNRRTDDVDVVVEEMDFGKFRMLCRSIIEKGFEALQVDISIEEGVKKLYNEYFMAGYKPRFVKKGVLLPNIEFKKASNTLEEYVLDNFYTVLMGDKGSIKISPLELQIAYKLWLGSDKDIGDARFLYKLFENFLDVGELRMWCEKLGVGMEWLE